MMLITARSGDVLVYKVDEYIFGSLASNKDKDYEWMKANSSRNFVDRICR